jgi:hypothetical protein
MIGPGKYDEEAVSLKKELNAQALILIVVGGPKGSGLSVKSDEILLAALPQVLRTTADLIEDEVKKDLETIARGPR